MTRAFSRAERAIMLTAALVIVIAGLKLASGLVAPFLMAVFVAIVTTPPLFWLTGKGVPNVLALVIVLLGIALTGALVVNGLSASMNELTTVLPAYKSKLALSYDNAQIWLGSFNIALPDINLTELVDPENIINVFNQMLNGLSGVIGNAFLVFIAVLFLLIDACRFPAKLRSVLKNPEQTMQHFKAFVDTVIHYLVLKSITSGITAVCVGLLLTWLDYDFIALWVTLAFLLNFIPYVGSIIAGLPPVVIGLIDHGAFSALSAAGGYVAINVIVGQIIETRLIGNKLNLSSFVVFVSLTFWGWVLGPVGMFLSIPLTMLLLIALESSENTRAYAALLKE